MVLVILNDESWPSGDALGEPVGPQGHGTVTVRVAIGPGASPDPDDGPPPGAVGDSAGLDPEPSPAELGVPVESDPDGLPPDELSPDEVAGSLGPGVGVLPSGTAVDSVGLGPVGDPSSEGLEEGPPSDGVPGSVAGTPSPEVVGNPVDVGTGAASEEAVEGSPEPASGEVVVSVGKTVDESVGVGGRPPEPSANDEVVDESPLVDGSTEPLVDGSTGVVAGGSPDVEESGDWPVDSLPPWPGWGGGSGSPSFLNRNSRA